MQGGFLSQSTVVFGQDERSRRRQCTPREVPMRSVLCILLATTTTLMIGCGTDSSTGGDDDDIPAGCGNASPDPGEQCDDGNDNDFYGGRKDCTMAEALTPTPMAWQYFEIPGTKCNDGTPAG